LRIVDRDNRQVPYLLERRQDVLALNLPFHLDQAASSPKQSHYQIDLPFENLPQGRLVLTTNERVFQRAVELQVKRPAADRPSDLVSETVASMNWRHADSETPAPSLPLDLHSSLGSSAATVIVEEGDNRPLALSGARLEMPLYRLRFFHPPDGTLNLLYGQDSLAAPRYDLELLAPRLVGSSSRELALDKENTTVPPPGNTRLQTQVFWGALVAAVLIVLFLLVRLLRSEKVSN
jgi:hypothetical protein